MLILHTYFNQLVAILVLIFRCNDLLLLFRLLLYLLLWQLSLGRFTLSSLPFSRFKCLDNRYTSILYFVDFLVIFHILLPISAYILSFLCVTFKFRILLSDFQLLLSFLIFANFLWDIICLRFLRSSWQWRFFSIFWILNRFLRLIIGLFMFAMSWIWYLFITRWPTIIFIILFFRRLWSSKVRRLLLWSRFCYILKFRLLGSFLSSLTNHLIFIPLFSSKLIYLLYFFSLVLLFLQFLLTWRLLSSLSL